MNYGHPTTEVFPRNARQSGTERAASVEKMRRRDWSGIVIVVVVALITASPYLVIAWRMP